jgi:hypothetical protein
MMISKPLSSAIVSRAVASLACACICGCASQIPLPSIAPVDATCRQTGTDGMPTPILSFAVEPLPVGTAAFAMRDPGRNIAIVLANELSLIGAQLQREISRVLGFRRDRGARLVVRLQSSENAGAASARAALQQRYPNVQFQRPGMAQARLIVNSPWIDLNRAVLPCSGHPLGEIAFELILSPEEVRRLLALETNALFLNGQLSYFEVTTGRFFTQSFGIRKSDVRGFGAH